MAWLMIPSGLIERGRKRKCFMRENLDYGRECFIGANRRHRKSLKWIA